MKTLKLTDEQFDRIVELVDKEYERSIRQRSGLLGPRPTSQAKIDKWSRNARLAEELLVAACPKRRHDLAAKRPGRPTCGVKRGHNPNATNDL